MNPTSTHGAAAALVDIGWSVFPTHEPDPGHGCSCDDHGCESQGKHPRVAGGCLKATRDFDVIDAWWSRWPGAGVGVAMGSVSGVFVLDVDGAEGAASLAELPRLPETVEATTGRGHHLYFRMPATGVDIRNSAGQVGVGLDVRGTGGYVIAPPSRHMSGRVYRWVLDPFDHGVADAPGWLVDLVVKPEPEPFPAPRELPEIRGERYVRAAIEAECKDLARTPKGQRNHALNRAAFSLARFVEAGDVDTPTVVRALAHAATQAGLGRVEIEKTTRSAFRARGVAA